MNKSVDAFRTISEVADELDIPKHVLRFWEVKFPQIKPMKRGGGRRYYRPEDIVLLTGIRNLLHAEGYTIKGVQKILREQGIDEVKLFSTAPIKAAGKSGRGRGVGDIERGGRVRPLSKRLVGAQGERSNRQRSEDGAQPALDASALIDAAIRELRACRSALMAAGGADIAHPVSSPSKRQARSR